MTIKAQIDGRLCRGCGAYGEGIFPVGWLVEYERGELYPGGPRTVRREHPYCPACQMKGAHRDRADA